jgi:two-component system, OmpR family, phosphate regulon sensor histidine kinase PhoR
LSKIERQGFELSLHETEVAGLIEDVMPILQEKAKSKDISLQTSFDSRGMAEVDSYRLKQVFINLISNGIVYTPKGGNVSITVQEDPHKVYVKIKDNGMGINQEELPRIFERFYRVDKARSRNSGGTGLGLAIVKHIIEAHEGNVDVESELNKGTTFTVTLNKKLSVHSSDKGKGNT